MIGDRKRDQSGRDAAHSILDAINVYVFGVDRAGRIYFANIAAAEALAGATGGLLGRRLADVFGPQSAITEVAISAARDGLTRSEVDLPLEGPGFSQGRVDVWAAPLDEPRGAALTLAPRPLARAEGTSRPLPPVARTLAHEVRNPLAGIRAAAQLLGRDANAESRLLTDMICAETDRIRRLTDRLDALDGMAPVRLAPMNIHEALERVRRLVASSFEDVPIVEAYDPSLPHVLGDMDLLIQAFLNLVKNAAEAVKDCPDPQVRVSTRYKPGLKIRRRGGAARHQLEVSVADNGPGLPPSLRGRVFEPFATTKAGGAGLGLAVTAQIVSQHDGFIEVDSRPGGTVFRVLLPIAEFAR